MELIDLLGVERWKLVMHTHIPGKPKKTQWEWAHHTGEFKILVTVDGATIWRKDPSPDPLFDFYVWGNFMALSSAQAAVERYLDYRQRKYREQAD